MSKRVLVFGPTGNVGSIVARTAQQHGAKVFLAMRDCHKPVPGLDYVQEASGGFERIQADLTEPRSIHSAVTTTKATSAFIYLAHRSSDHMRAALETFKASGISFIVFLSSFTINPGRDLDKIPPTSRIPWIHAQVEKNLEEIYGSKNFVALRAGAFATNTLRWRAGIQAGEVELQSPNTEYDFITPTDMGTVGGKILADGQVGGQHVVYLYGPRLLAQKDAFAIVARALGKEAEIVSGGQRASAPDSSKVLVRLGPEEERSDWFSVAYDNHEEGVGNVMKYTGKPATAYKDWIEENTARFSVL